MRAISVPMLAGLVLGVGLVCAGVCEADNSTNSGREDYWCTFLDALGEPVAEADVEIFRKEADGSKTLVKKTKLDELGCLREPRPGRKEIGSYFLVVTHGDYGTAAVNMSFHRVANKIELGLVKAGSQADVRGIQGVVVDDANNPVSGAVVFCYGIRLPGDESVGVKMGGVLTNDEGRFWLYPPLRNSGDEMGTLIPPRSKFDIEVNPKAEDGLLEFRTRVAAGEKTRIKLERGSYFRTFVFDDEHGRITNPDRLKRIHMYVRREGVREIDFTYEQLKDGGMFPLGRYRAVMWGGADEWIKDFVVVEITEDSPSEIVFKIRPAYVYCGQVVDGVTGAPMEGVFAAACEGSRNLAVIKPEQWGRFRRLPRNPPITDALFQELRDDNLLIRAITRTDKKGRFELRSEPGEGPYPIVAFEKDFMIFVRKYFPDPNEGECIQVPTIRLYPAAQVSVGCYTEGGHTGFKPIFHAKAEGNPPWIRPFLESHRSGDVLHHGIRTNRDYKFYMPACLNLRIELRTASLSKWCSLILEEEFHFEQGEVFDLGQIQLERKMNVCLQVLNSSGEGVEGVCVALGATGTRRNTDEQGYVIFDVAPYSKGEFVVDGEQSNGNSSALREVLPYSFGGPKDANSVYTLKLSDEMVGMLFGK